MTTMAIAPRPRARARRTLLAAAVLAGGTFLASQLAAPTAPTAPGISPSAPAVALPNVAAMPVPLDRVDAAIATWSANLERDGADFIAATHLAELYVARGRITGLAADYARASDAVEQALRTEPDLLSARLVGAQGLLDAHDFAGAARAASAILRDHPELPQALAMLGDAQVEMGAYAAAERTYARLSMAVDAPAVVARQAKLLATTGSLEVARQLADRALRAARADPATAATDVAWYHMLAGTLALQAGDLRGAEASFASSIELDPTSEPARVALGRTLAAQGRDEAAMAAYERAIAIAPHPDSLGALADLLLLSGRTEEAERRYAQADALDAMDPEGSGLVSVDRAVILYLADHGKRTRYAVRLAEADLAKRRDVRGWDVLAWALLADGQVERAEAAMRRARAQGTQDPLLDYHAGMIAAAAGRPAEAADLLRRALAVNPNFDPLQATRAREMLLRLASAA